VNIHEQSSLAHKGGSHLPLEAGFSECKKKIIITIKISVAEEGTTEVDDKESAVPSVTYLPVNQRWSVTLRP